MDLSFSDLSRWQRMRFVNLAVAAGGSRVLDRLAQRDCGSHNNVKFTPLSAAEQEQQNTANKDDDTSTNTNKRCSCCGKDNAVAPSVRFPFADAGRSLVDKHFDALSQAMSEVGVTDFGVTGAGDGDLEILLPAVSCEVVVTPSAAASSSSAHDETAAKKTDQQHPDSVCFLCALALLSNNPSLLGVVPPNNTKQHPWWWADKFEPDYCNMDTGDIGPADPVEDLIMKPLVSWSENCRWLLSSTAERLFSKREQERMRREEEEEEEAETCDGERSSQMAVTAVAHNNFLDSVAKFFSNEKLAAVTISLLRDDVQQRFSVQFESSSEQSQQQQFPAVGFNRTKIKPAVSATDNTTDMMSRFFQDATGTPLSYSLFLSAAMSAITQGYAQAAVLAAATAKKDDGAGAAASSRLAAALTAAIFSDARRRMVATTSQQSGVPGGMMGGGGMMAMPGGGFPMLSSSSMIPTMTQEGGEMKKPSVEDMITMMRAAQPQLSSGGGSSSSSSNGPVVQKQPAPPFSLPLSLYEETLILMKHRRGGGEEVVDNSSNSNMKSLSELRVKVELTPEDEFAEEYVPKPTYVGEFANALAALSS